MLPGGVPSTEFSDEFVARMKNRMAMSFYKYGPLADAYPEKIDAMATLAAHVEKYLASGNTELLVDISNYAMIEFMRPRHVQAHFVARDSDQSLGRVWHTGTQHQGSHREATWRYRHDGD
jgi:hypothetical protein